MKILIQSILVVAAMSAFVLRGWTAESKDWPPEGRLGLPLGTIAKIKGVIVAGDDYGFKDWQGDYLIEVREVKGVEGKGRPVMKFERAPTTNITDYPPDDRALYEIRTGRRAKWIDSDDMKELRKGYVGREIHLLVWETGMFDGIPENMPSDIPLWQDHNFGFSTWLVLLDDLSPKKLTIERMEGIPERGPPAELFKLKKP